MDSLVVEKLSEKYVLPVFELEKKLIGNASIDTIKNTLSSETLDYYVLLDGDLVIGFFECMIIAPEAELYDIAIDNNFQGKGYSKILMEYFLTLSKQKGCNTILLEVNKINNKAISLYKKFGFVVYGERKNYYGDNDAVLMKLEII